MQEKIAVVGGGRSARKTTLAWIAEHSSELKKTDALIAFEQEMGMEVPVDIEGHLQNNPKDAIPKTIESLRVWADVMKLPLDKMNIHIGEDCPVKNGKAYGVYKDGDNFIVYKNHNDKEHRDIRYQGPDESVAVGMLYERMVYWL